MILVYLVVTAGALFYATLYLRSLCAPVSQALHIRPNFRGFGGERRGAVQVADWRKGAGK